MSLNDPAIYCFLESIYAECNKPERLGLDPLAVVKEYQDADDIEVAGLVCATLAFGSVRLIMDACRMALAPLGRHPARTLAAMTSADMAHAWGNFQYRFCFPKDMIALMRAIRAAREEYGSLEGLFLACHGKTPAGGANRHAGVCSQERARFIEAASAFARALRARAPELRSNLLPDPADGSACKRLFLYLRWMVRHDAIDPGPWRSVGPERLVVPLDIHMVRTCRERLGFLPPRKGTTSNPNLADALRVTELFARYAPDDPVKYDFALTRPGIDPRPGDERFGCL